MKNKDIRNFNSKWVYHGYQELYESNIISFRGSFKNNLSIGYQEYHSYFGMVTEYYII